MRPKGEGHDNRSFSGHMDDPEGTSRQVKDASHAKGDWVGLEDVNTHVKMQESPAADNTKAQWTNQREFLLSCISMTVGMSNVWRFPHTALENGGGAFLVPYILILIFVGMPLYYMELCFGQFSSSGVVRVWEISPAFRGIGYGQAFCIGVLTTFYTSIMGLCVFYFFASFGDVLPWAYCGEWASPKCVDGNTSAGAFINSSDLVTASEEYFKREVLKEDPLGFQNGLGVPDWRLLLCLLFSWVTVFLVMCRGVKSSGKVAYFTAIFPYLVLFILLGRGVTLPGSYRGILYFITPRWEKLLEPGVWFAAMQQSFYSLGVGFGLVITLASYNDFRHNVYRSAAIVSFMDTFACLLSGFTTFAILGSLADMLGIEVEEVVRNGGTSLTFITYPNALAKFQFVPQLFSALFFLMLFTLGLGSNVVNSNCICTLMFDKYPHFAKWKVTFGVCTIGFLSGIGYTTPQGQRILTLVDHYGTSAPVVLLMFFELVAVMWVYGVPSFIKDINFMQETKTGTYWKISWGIFNPIFLIFIFVYSQVTAEPLAYGSDAFGTVPTAIGITIFSIACLMVPAFLLVEVLRKRQEVGHLKEALKKAFLPTDKWCPRDSYLHKQYLLYVKSDN